jgi:hypothetical protein
MLADTLLDTLTAQLVSAKLTLDCAKQFAAIKAYDSVLREAKRLRSELEEAITHCAHIEQACHASLRSKAPLA